MKTMALRSLSKRNPLQKLHQEASLLSRLRNFLLRDLLPSLVMVIVLGLLASLVGHKIEQSKNHNGHSVEISAHRP